MLRNYILVSLRNLIRQKLFSAIKIFGLALGLGCSILLLLYVSDELTYDSFHEQAGSIFRVVNAKYDSDGSVLRRTASLPAVAGPKFAEYFPEIQTAIRYIYGNGVIRYGDQAFNETFVFTDTDFFDVFTFPLIAGNPTTVLQQDNAIILTESQARKFFGESNPLGKQVKVIFGQTEKEFLITGIAEDLPGNSTIRFNVVVHIENLKIARRPNALSSWGDFATHIYVKIPDPGNVSTVTERLPYFVDHYFAGFINEMKEAGFWKGDGRMLDFDLQRITDLHVDTTVAGGTGYAPTLLLSGIALLILIVAGINFVNLSIGTAFSRVIEIGVRKVVGAQRKQLVQQFWVETVLILIISLTIAFGLADIYLQNFSEIVSKNLSWASFFSATNISVVIIAFFFVSTSAAAYPALILSSFKPVQIFRTKFRVGGKNSFTRLLVVAQFALSIFLFICAIGIGKQINFMLNKELGFNKDGVIVIDLQERNNAETVRIAELFRKRVSGLSGFEAATAADGSFGKSEGSSYVSYEGRDVDANRYNIDSEYLTTLDITLLEGRPFSGELARDSSSAIVNMKFVKTAGMTSPLGHTVYLHKEIPLTIIGIVDDYHFSSLEHEIAPVILYRLPDEGFSDVLVRVSSNDLSGKIRILREIWQDIQPQKPFVYSFMDEDLADFYASERQMESIVNAASVFALLISCMGIFGLTTITIGRRIKEIGIRKVLGAHPVQIMNLLFREFIFLILAANVIAWPAAYLTLQSILQDYYYRTIIGFEFFVIAGLLSLMIAIVTISYLTIRASLANPVDSLRYE